MLHVCSRESKEMDSAEGEGEGAAFPTSRVKKVIKGQSDVKTSAEALFVINKAAEKFVDKFVEDACQHLLKDKQNVLEYKHLSATVAAQKRYEFLADFVPQTIKAQDALAQRNLT